MAPKAASGAKPKPKAKDPKTMPQPKDQVGTRTGCRRYRWEIQDSNKQFWTKGHAEVKVLSLVCLLGTTALFHSVAVHPVLRVIIMMEITVFIFFILLYSFAINRYTSFILWPVTDLLNDLITCAFLLGAVVYGVRIRSTLPKFYLMGLVLMVAAGFFALIDVGLQRNYFVGTTVKKDVGDVPKGKAPEPPKKA
ncbi:CKLF-like MARVEL transmembrane domain-containing protein 2 [Nycticebus coucang]|uniref:CKLF-like MARVEL transmembrane domain-containing protein 2 n=1 Tax=Nycticebus coucang TaxID=9470 RepID=UPI00234DE1B4|nr:CKLF-like MARVEL transmembrane domain-containing protein 2 [Nycticebus coucang]